MSPTIKSLLILLISGALFTTLLVKNQSQDSARNSISSAKSAANLLNRHLNDKIEILSEAVKNFSRSPLWQTSSINQWSQYIKSNEPVFKAAGIDNLGIHTIATDILFMDITNRPGQLLGLQQPLARLYKSGQPFLVIHPFKKKPAIIFLSPIKASNNQIIGALIGIRTMDVNFLKTFHSISNIPVVMLKNNTLFSLSIDETPEVSSKEQIAIRWPNEMKSSIWKLALLAEKTSLFTGKIWLIVVGLFITLVSAGLTWMQLKKSSKSITTLCVSLIPDLPIAEQIKQLTNLEKTSKDMALVDCITSVKGRFQQLNQQNKDLSLEIKKLNENLKQVNQHKKQIIEQRDSAVAAPRLKSEFLSRMGDEITTPMKSVVSMLKLLSEYSFESEPKQLLNIAKRSTMTLVDNLNNILDFSKLDANMLKLKSKEFSVRELIDDLASDLQTFANEKQLSLQASSDSEVPSILIADAFRIRQILRNLLANAIRFTSKGDVKLFVETTVKGGQKLLRFTIKDSGIGMTPEAQKDIFVSLQQTTKLNNSSFTGRLRLIVSKYLAELMGGEIGVESELGEGTTFWFTVIYKT